MSNDRIAATFAAIDAMTPDPETMANNLKECTALYGLAVGSLIPSSDEGPSGTGTRNTGNCDLLETRVYEALLQRLRTARTVLKTLQEWAEGPPDRRSVKKTIGMLAWAEMKTSLAFLLLSARESPSRRSLTRFPGPKTHLGNMLSLASGVNAPDFGGQDMAEIVGKAQTLCSDAVKSVVAAVHYTVFNTPLPSVARDDLTRAKLALAAETELL